MRKLAARVSLYPLNSVRLWNFFYYLKFLPKKALSEKHEVYNFQVFLFAGVYGPAVVLDASPVFPVQGRLRTIRGERAIHGPERTERHPTQSPAQHHSPRDRERRIP